MAHSGGAARGRRHGARAVRLRPASKRHLHPGDRGRSGCRNQDLSPDFDDRERDAVVRRAGAVPAGAVPAGEGRPGRGREGVRAIDRRLSGRDRAGGEGAGAHSRRDEAAAGAVCGRRNDGDAAADAGGDGDRHAGLCRWGAACRGAERGDDRDPHLHGEFPVCVARGGGPGDPAAADERLGQPGAGTLRDQVPGTAGARGGGREAAVQRRADRHGLRQRRGHLRHAAAAAGGGIQDARCRSLRPRAADAFRPCSKSPASRRCRRRSARCGRTRCTWIRCGRRFGSPPTPRATW